MIVFFQTNCQSPVNSFELEPSRKITYAVLLINENCQHIIRDKTTEVIKNSRQNSKIQYEKMSVIKALAAL